MFVGSKDAVVVFEAELVGRLDDLASCVLSTDGARLLRLGLNVITTDSLLRFTQEKSCTPVEMSTVSPIEQHRCINILTCYVASKVLLNIMP